MRIPGHPVGVSIGVQGPLTLQRGLVPGVGADAGGDLAGVRVGGTARVLAVVPEAGEGGRLCNRRPCIRP